MNVCILEITLNKVKKRWFAYHRKEIEDVMIQWITQDESSDLRSCSRTW